MCLCGGLIQTVPETEINKIELYLSEAGTILFRTYPYEIIIHAEPKS